MGSFIKKNKLCILLLLTIIIFIIVFNIIYYSSQKHNRGVIQYDSIHDGDIIPFNSKIEGDSYLHVKFAGNYTNYYYVSFGTYKSFLSVSYCKSEQCLKDNNYYKMDSLLNLGDTVSFSYNVLSYNEVFKNNNKKYTAWKVYLKGPMYSTIHEINYLGTYYNLVLVPTTYDKNECLYDEDNIIYMKNIDYNIDNIDSGWKNENSIYSYEETGNSDLSFKFKAKKNDIVFFDLKSNTNTLNIYLNNKNINEDLNIDNSNEQYNNYLLYNSKSIVIDKDGEYVLKFKENFKRDKYNKNYYNYTYVRNLKILSKVDNKEDAENYYVKCNNEVLVGSIDEL